MFEKTNKNIPSLDGMVFYVIGMYLINFSRTSYTFKCTYLPQGKEKFVVQREIKF